ncbi:MAG: sigma-E processing peptidase SpoIIGA [Clostridia bacterium]|nr:sigma-E processing peptidase SpoIIGA [Clostridia bacterium]
MSETAGSCGDYIRQTSPIIFILRKLLAAIIACTMQVYVELAVAENFCMDFTLLYCAKLVCKNSASVLRVVTASAAGACFAVVFPLFRLGAILSVVIKLLSGLIICLLAGKYKSFKAYVKMSALFLAFTALLGGALIGVFALTGMDYLQGGGYVLSSVPIGIPLFAALLILMFARKLAAKLKKVGKTTVKCKIFSGEKCVEISGFFDSGNKVYYSGQPVSVIPLTAALKIVDAVGIKEAVKIHTVAGSKKLKIFTADKVEIYGGEKTEVVKNVKIGISPTACGAVLHPDLMEE